MIELAAANVTYVAWRLFVSGNIVLFFYKLLHKKCSDKVSWYGAVFLMAQVSFMYDFVIFKYFI